MCEKDQVATFPPLCFSYSDNSAILTELPVETSIDGEHLSGLAQVKLDLLPSPNVYVYCSFTTVDLTGAVTRVLSSPDVITSLEIDGLKLDGFGLRSDYSLADRKLDVKWCPSREPVSALGGKSTSIRTVFLHLFNLDFSGRPGSIHRDSKGSHTIEHIDLGDDIWHVRIRSLSSTGDNRRILQKEGGFRLTHIAELCKKDNGTISGEEAENVLDAIRMFLCFAKGTQCDPICPYGVDSKGDIVWKQWSSPREWERSPLSWFERTDPSSLSNLFPGFMQRWANESWRDALHDCIWLYANSNSGSRDIGVGLVSAQTALERLSYEYCVQERKLIGKQGFKIYFGCGQT